MEPFTPTASIVRASCPMAPPMVRRKRLHTPTPAKPATTSTAGRSRSTRKELGWWANCLGLTGAPFDSYLTLRGVRTLHARIRQHEENAGQLALQAEGLIKTIPEVSRYFVISGSPRLRIGRAMKEGRSPGGTRPERMAARSALAPSTRMARVPRAARFVSAENDGYASTIDAGISGAS